MYTLKGFFKYAPLVNNNPDQISTFGELSDDCMTYAKDKTFHTSDTTAQTTLIAFHSVRDETVVDLPGNLRTTALNLGQFILNQAQLGTITDDAYTFRQMVLAEFAGLIEDFSCGNMLDDGQRFMPEWIRYKASNAGEENAVTLWLANDSFASQFDEYIIEIIPPLANLNNFFLTPIEVREQLRAYNLVEKLEEVQVKRGQYPYTRQQAFRYDYHNPSDATFTEPSHWIVVVYGQAGNNPDIIREAIAAYALANSTHTRDEWVAILPDLFLTTEFIITPFWNNYSVPNAEFQAGIHSPTIDPRVALALLKLTTKGANYTDAWIEAQWEISAMLYKSLAFGVVGNPENRDGIVRFSDKFTDYMMVTNTSSDFDRISTTTQEWITKFAALIHTAESFDEFASVPTGMARIIRNGVVYVSTYFDDVNYLVVAKSSVESIQ